MKKTLEERRGRKHISTKTPKETKKKNVNESEDLFAEMQRVFAWRMSTLKN